MLGVRNFGIVLSTRWSKQLVVETIDQLGDFGYCPPEAYRLGYYIGDDSALRADNILSVHNPATQIIRTLGGFYYLKRPLTFSAVINLTNMYCRSLSNMPEIEIAAEHSGFLEGSLALSRLGWRCISEQEWEAAVFRCPVTYENSIAESQFREFARKCEDSSSSATAIYEEWSSSLGYAMDPTEWGTDAEVSLRNSSWFHWPGVIIRGWRSDYGADPRSRFSSRNIGDNVVFRPVIEEAFVNAMDTCPLKEYFLSRRQGSKSYPPGIHIDCSGIII